MATKVIKKNHDTPDETKKFANGKLDVVNLGEFTLGRATFEPGWKWSVSLKPLMKTNSCQVHHVLYVVSGRMGGVMDDGTKWETGPGDSLDLPPGHDAWTLGDESVVFIDFMSAD